MYDGKRMAGDAELMFLVLVVSIVSTVFANAAERPNIILIMSDDMGYSDLGCYGGEIATPSLDRLAETGVRYTQFYNTARCCPTRASLLTGLHPHQAGIGHMMEHRNLPGYQGDLLPTTVTIAEVLREAGYRNYCVGKWHVTRQMQSGGSTHNWPLQRGFDRYYGIINGAANFFDPAHLVRDNTAVSPFDDPEYRPEKPFYLTHALSDHAMRFIREHKGQAPDQPFFMYVAYTAAHWPMQAPDDAIAENKGKYDVGYDAIRAARYARMKDMGLIDERWELSPQAENWAAVDDKAWESRCMETYAAMIGEMDAGIGQIVETLKNTGQYENTVILFLQDNGACAEEIGRGKTDNRVDPNMRGHDPIPKNQPIENRQSTESRTRDGYPVLRGEGVMPGPENTFVAYGRGWANVSNTPFREYKHWVHEGGISTPLIVHSPNLVASSMRGRFYREPGQLPDLMATCVELAGAKYPARYKGNDITPYEGTSLVPGFSGETLNRQKPLVWEHEGNRAIREGKWKLVAKGPLGEWELYDIENDRSEMRNLAAQHPDRVRTMAAQWQQWAERANVVPWPWDTRADTTPGLKFELDFTKEQGKFIDRSGKNNVVTVQGIPAVTGTSERAFAVFDGKSHIAVEKSAALHCAKTPLSVEVVLNPSYGNGVIFASGGSLHGYSLYLRNDKPVFAVRVDRKVYTATSDKIVTDWCTIKGVITPDRKAELYIDGEKVAMTQLPDFIVENPGEAMQIGADLGGQVGPVNSPNFQGDIERVTIHRL